MAGTDPGLNHSRKEVLDATIIYNLMINMIASPAEKLDLPGHFLCSRIPT